MNATPGFLLLPVLLGAAIVSLPSLAFGQTETSPVTAQWLGQGGSKSMQRYSPLADVNAATFKKLKVLWTRSSVDKIYRDAFPDLSPSNYLRGTPTVVDGVAYVSNGIGLIEAFDAATGVTKWVQTPLPVDLRRAAADSSRSVEYWSDGKDKRVVTIRGKFLNALDAETGKPAPGFGDNGSVYVGWATQEDFSYSGTSGPLIVGDVIVVGGRGGVKVGGGSGDLGDRWEGHSDDVRGYDVRTGHLLWTFHVVPQPGEPGFESWKSDAWKSSGAQGAWSPMSADEALGMVYVPLSAPPMYYGGHREGDNLYGSSLVALDAKTGKRVWHFQMVHHDLWDYDLAAPPVLADLVVDGRPIKAVIQAGKTGFLYVFDRATGKPVWPIEERPVPQSDIPGEHTSPTQPFPSKPPAFDLQGVSLADIASFTPETEKEARAVAAKYRLGPLFTPPSLVTETSLGTLASPGVWGSGNWNTGAFDPETGRYYAVSRTKPTVYGLIKAPDPAASTAYIIPTPVVPGKPAVAASGAAKPDPYDHGGLPLIVPLPSGLPIIKPPYGRITAYDMNKGDKLWTIANGDDPQIRANPALKGAKFAPTGIASRVPLVVTKSLLLVPDGSSVIWDTAGYNGPAKLSAYDKRTGAMIGQVPMPAGATTAPVSYPTKAGQRIVVAVSSTALGASWVAYGLE